MKTSMMLLENYGEFKKGESVRVDVEDVEELIEDGIARYPNQADKDRDTAKEIAMADKLAREVKAEIKAELGFAGHKIPGQPGMFAAEGWGPQNPKKFWQSEAPSGSQFDNAADFLKAVAGSARGEWDNRLKDLSSTIGAEGGYLIPAEMSSMIWMEVLESSPFFSQATLLPMESNNISVPFVFDEDRSTSGIHGVTIPHPTESSALADISPKFGLANLKLHKIGGRCRVPNELLEDSKEAMGVLLPRIFSDALSWRMQYEFLAGSGAGECQGILNSPATISVTKESAQAAATIEYKNIIKMWSRLLPSARKTAVWMFNLDCEVQIRTMSLTVGTGGSSAFVLNAASNLPETIFGRPVFFTEFLPTLGEAGDCVVFNPRAYAIGRKIGQSLRIESSEHTRFENDQVVFRALTRVDGQGLQSGPITPHSGSANTLSNFVKLGARA